MRMCEACEAGDHLNCGMQTWCECECAGPDSVEIPQPHEAPTVPLKDQEVEVASRAIWDQYAGDCNSDCRWGQMCHCETMSREWAVAAIEALAKHKTERGEELARLAIGNHQQQTSTEK